MNIKDFKYNVGEIINDRLILERSRGGIDSNSKNLKRYKCKCIHCGRETTKTEQQMNCNCVCFKRRQFKYEIGIKINSKTILEQVYKDNEKYYRFKCDCGHEGYIQEKSLGKTEHCIKCFKKEELPEWMTHFIKNKNMIKNITRTSLIEIDMCCPLCKEVKKCSPNRLYNKGNIGCLCSRAMSLPEKTLYALLLLNDINFIHDKTLDWSKNKRYDFFLPEYNTIIELHGKQHFKNTTFSKNLKELQDNDLYKEYLAIKNNVMNYIVLDCSKCSNIKQTIDAILNTDFFKKIITIYDLKLIKEYISFNSQLHDVCKYYEENKPILIKDLGDIFFIDVHTINRYLRSGNEVGLCVYNEDEQRIFSHKNAGQSKKSIQIIKNGIVIGEYESAKELELISEVVYGVKLHRSKISNCCNGKRKTHKGFEFKFKDN